VNSSWLNKSLNRVKRHAAVRRLLDTMPRGSKAFLRRSVDRISTRSDERGQLRAAIGVSNTMLAQLLYTTALQSERYQEPKRLIRHGFKVYSQHDEDGITEEIFRRIGETNRFFVEFGVGDGTENGTVYCLLKGWSGVWIDGSAVCVDAIERTFDFLIRERRLSVRYSFITAENIERLFTELGVPAEFDLLSIDIDNNDYWVWKAIERFSPRVVAIEYNASFRDSVNCVVPYQPTAIWNYTNYFGASLKALEKLGSSKGYNLVGCNFTGVTAFFVRSDLVGDKFAAPFVAENHYEPPRHYLPMPNGHPPGFGPLVSSDGNGG
jgi:hypothetical protein